MIDTVLFDLDGTIVHHGNALIPPLLAVWGHPRPLDEVEEAVARAVSYFYNHIAQAEQQGWVDELFLEFHRQSLVNLNIPDAKLYAHQLRAFFDTNPVPPLFEDVKPLLDDLQGAGFAMGVITQRGREGAEEFLAGHQVTDYFDVLVAGDDGHGRKPGSGPFDHALSVLQREAGRAVYVGDRIDDDCEGARGAGLANAFLIDRIGVFALEADQRDDFVHLTDLRHLLSHLPTPT